MTSLFIAVGDTAAHNGYIREMDADDVWCNENPSGWTYQDVTGAHGHILGEFDTEEEAQEVLDNFLQCDSVETGRYCYTHNPSGN